MSGDEENYSNIDPMIFFRFLELLDNIRYCKYNNISIYLKILFLSKFEKKNKINSTHQIS